MNGHLSWGKCSYEAKLCFEKKAKSKQQCKKNSFHCDCRDKTIKCRFGFTFEWLVCQQVQNDVYKRRQKCLCVSSVAFLWSAGIKQRAFSRIGLRRRQVFCLLLSNWHWGLRWVQTLGTQRFNFEEVYGFVWSSILGKQSLNFRRRCAAKRVCCLAYWRRCVVPIPTSIPRLLFCSYCRVR